jgi:Pvc16 N-terminal domain
VSSLFEEADARLTEWVGGVAGPDVQVALTAPANQHSGAGVSLFLMDLVSQQPMRGQERAPLQLALRYLVTAWAEDPVAEHRLLGALVAAAMQEEGFDVLLSPTPPATWSALGAAPRPAFVLQVPVRQTRPEAALPRVRGPLVVRGVALAPLAGVVLGPGDVPVASARVEVPSADAVAETDTQGRFRFPGLPVEPRQKLVRVRARGRQLDVEIAQPEGSSAVVIRFDQLLEA